MKPLLDTHVYILDFRFLSFITNNKDLTALLGDYIKVTRQWPPDRKLGLDRNGPIHTMDDEFVATTVRDLTTLRLVIRVEGIKFEYESKGYLYMSHERLFNNKVREFMTEWKYELEEDYVP